MVTLESITISGPTKTEYKIGEELDLTGLVVIAHYSDGSYQEVTDYEVSGFDSAAAGEKTVTVTYQGETVSFKITVKEGTASSEQPENPASLMITNPAASLMTLRAAAEARTIRISKLEIPWRLYVGVKLSY